MGAHWPECDVAVRDWLERVVHEFGEELGENHVGTYLHGSLASGSFYPPKSDVDLLFVVHAPLTAQERRSFWFRCAALSQDRPIVGGLESSAILAATALEARHPMPVEAHFAEASELEAHGESDAVESLPANPDLITHCQAIIEGGICLRGRRIDEVFGPVDPLDFEHSVSGDVDWILEAEHIVESPFYGVLNLCRAMWVWSRHSRRLAPSKEEAGEWAVCEIPEYLVPVVLDALLAYRDPADVSPKERRTAGRVWDRAALLRFRDYVRSVRVRHTGAI